MAIDAGTAPGSAGAEFAHALLIYRDDDEYASAVTTLARDGGPFLISVPPGKHELVRDALGPAGRGIQVRDVTVGGRNPGRIIASGLSPFLSAHPDRPVHVFGEPVWPERDPLDLPACLQFEALVNVAFPDAAATILCAYDGSALSPEILDGARRTHPATWRDGALVPEDAYADPLGVWEEFNVALPAAPAWAEYLVFDVDSLGDVRAAVAKAAACGGLTAGREEDAVLVGSELATNTCRHAPGGNGALTTWTEDGRFVIDISDGGYLRDPLAGRLAAGPDRLAGRGLAVVNRLADLVRVHTTPRGTTVRAYFDVAGTD